MIDLLTYCIDSPALVQEILQKYPEKIIDNGDGSFTFNVNKIPTVRSGVNTICLVRCVTPEDEAMIRGIIALEVLGTYTEVFANPLLDAKYKSVYPYDIPIEYTDEYGATKSYMRSQKIGEFA